MTALSEPGTHGFPGGLLGTSLVLFAEGEAQGWRIYDNKPLDLVFEEKRD